MKTTIAVAVTLKVEATGDTADDLINDALLTATCLVDRALYKRVSDARTITVEGATALVDRPALERAFP